MAEPQTTSPPTAPRTLAELRAVCLKKLEAWDSAHLYRPISIRITWLLVRTPVSPNMVTVAGGILGMIGVGLFAYTALPDWARLCGLLLVEAAIVFDHVDGELARATRRFSPGGLFLDTFVTEIFLHLAITAGLAAAVYLQLGGTVWLTLGAFLLFLKSLSIATFYARGYLTERKRRGGTSVSQPTRKVSAFQRFGSLFWEVRKLTNTILVVFIVDWALRASGTVYPVVRGITLTPLSLLVLLGVLFLGLGLAGSVLGSARGRYDVNMEPYA